MPIIKAVGDLRYVLPNKSGIAAKAVAGQNEGTAGNGLLCPVWSLDPDAGDMAIFHEQAHGARVGHNQDALSLGGGEQARHQPGPRLFRDRMHAMP